MKRRMNVVKGWTDDDYKLAQNSVEHQIDVWNHVIEKCEETGVINTNATSTLKNIRPEIYVPQSVFEVTKTHEQLTQIRCDAIMKYLTGVLDYGIYDDYNTWMNLRMDVPYYLVLAYRNKEAIGSYGGIDARPVLVTIISVYSDDVTLEYLLEKFIKENRKDFYYLENDEVHYYSSVIDVVPLDGRAVTSYQIDACDMGDVLQSIDARLDCIYNISDMAHSTKERFAKLSKRKNTKMVEDAIDEQFSPKTDAELNEMTKELLNSVFGQGVLNSLIKPSKEKKKNKKKKEKSSDSDMLIQRKLAELLELISKQYSMDSDTRQPVTEEVKPINTKICNDGKNTDKEN